MFYVHLVIYLMCVVCDVRCVLYVYLVWLCVVFADVIFVCCMCMLCKMYMVLIVFGLFFVWCV